MRSGIREIAGEHAARWALESGSANSSVLEVQGRDVETRLSNLKKTTKIGRRSATRWVYRWKKVAVVGATDSCGHSAFLPTNT